LSSPLCHFVTFPRLTARHGCFIKRRHIVIKTSSSATRRFRIESERSAQLARHQIIERHENPTVNLALTVSSGFS
jgi:hypothetical protein